jgi:hypothetical protein
MKKTRSTTEPHWTLTVSGLLKTSARFESLLVTLLGQVTEITVQASETLLMLDDGTGEVKVHVSPPVAKYELHRFYSVVGRPATDRVTKSVLFVSDRVFVVKDYHEIIHHKLSSLTNEKYYQSSCSKAASFFGGVSQVKSEASSSSSSLASGGSTMLGAAKCLKDVLLALEKTTPECEDLGLTIDAVCSTLPKSRNYSRDMVVGAFATLESDGSIYETNTGYYKVTVL